jgi:hypothetical protein
MNAVAGPSGKPLARHRIVATQAELIGEPAGSTRQLLIDPDQEQFRVGGVELLNRLTVTAAARRPARRAAATAARPS